MFGAVHANVKEGHDEKDTTRGASLRELQRFFKEHDKDEGYAGLRRIADEDGTAVWTILKETEVTTKLEERTKERTQEERRHEEIFSAHITVDKATYVAWEEKVIEAFYNSERKVTALFPTDEQPAFVSKQKYILVSSS